MFHVTVMDNLTRDSKSHFLQAGDDAILLQGQLRASVSGSEKFH